MCSAGMLDPIHSAAWAVVNTTTGGPPGKSFEKWKRRVSGHWIRRARAIGSVPERWPIVFDSLVLDRPDGCRREIVQLDHQGPRRGHRVSLVLLADEIREDR